MQSNHNHSDDNEIPSSLEHSDFEATQDKVTGYGIITFHHEIPKEYSSFVIANWLNSLRSQNDMFKLMDSKPYYENYSKYIEAILKRRDTVAKIAVLSDDQDVTLGFSVSERDILHYVFVKEDLRHQGISTALIPKGIKIISHITKPGLSIWNNKYPKFKFNPF